MQYKPGASLKVMKATPSKTKKAVAGRPHRPGLKSSEGRLRVGRNQFYSSAGSGMNELKPLNNF